MAETNYIVFERNGDGFKELGQVNASTPKMAIERMAERIAAEREQEIEKAQFAATPYRNWTVLPVGVEVVRRVKVG